MPERRRAPGAVGRVRAYPDFVQGLPPALEPGWRWACRICPPVEAYSPTEPTREAAHARLTEHQLAEHRDHYVIAALIARAKTRTES